ncbi:DUF3300 domain-containing protein [Ramlibacter paludis]|uniref:DUF3300 domain-containing protein n=1 Tax=Ramlibacter paludis TaxID=2908000 RepID=UPI0023DA1A6E|nr:DUF3300 domain-containing protein [Ramlibacter paludis]
MSRPSHILLAAVALACISLALPPRPVFAQVPAAPTEAVAGKVYSAAELEKLVGPFALYPDDLVAIIIPASTFPLQIVQADRFLEKRKTDTKLQIDAAWDDSVKSLVNYPEVVKKMSNDLDWTEDLGEAVVADTASVMEAVQAFRRRAQTAGNLKTDKQQTVVVEQEVIKIEPTDPQVVYVPQYEPSQVVVYGASPYYYPYSPPYPAYWYPYAPGAALAAGVIWGAALGAVWGGGHYVSHYGGNNNITINRGNNNVNTGNIGSGNRGGGNRTNAGNSTWKSNKQPGQVAGGGGNRQGNRAGDGRGGTGTMGAGPRGGAGGGDRAGAGAGAGGRGGAGGPSASTRPSGGGGDAFGGINSGSSANRASSRGNESRASHSGASRSSAGGGGARASGGFSGGGGARAGGGGGGGRGGGGGGRGGGGRR